jgi:hypothetical protein
MDISVIKADQTNSDYGIHIGNNKDKQMIEFINLRCPYSRDWFFASKDILNNAVEEGRLERIIKLTDKSKDSLQRGNVMHRFVTTDNPEQALADIEKIFNSQEDWAYLSLPQVEDYAKNVLGLTEHNHKDYAKEIADEADKANIKFVPTIILDENIFDESIEPDLLKSYVK